MKKILKSMLSGAKQIFLALLGFIAALVSAFIYAILWSCKKVLNFIRSNDTLTKIVITMAKIGDYIYLPIYYTFYAICVILRVLVCVCYIFMFRFERAKRAIKLIFN